MAKYEEYRKIHDAILDAMDKAPLKRDALIFNSLLAFELTPDEYADNSTNGRRNIIKSKIGSAINEMLKKGILELSPDGNYTRNFDKPMAIRIERCEEAILELLKKGPLSRFAIRERLSTLFRIKETSTNKDDNKLFSYMGQILKRLTEEKVLQFDGTKYSVAKAMSATLGNRQEIIALRADFLTLLHSKGGEFFEHYFMNLLAKYLVRCGKTVIESKTTGGSDDGGIDGIAKTLDSLGFRETVMVQTKNRLDHTTETEVRGFYGAVCAAQGSRGIFVTSSDFHPMAKKFLDSIDNCVGVNGEKLFAMATDVSYGICRHDGRLTIDKALFEVV